MHKSPTKQSQPFWSKRPPNQMDRTEQSDASIVCELISSMCPV